MFDIEEELKKLPEKPGVYLMKDKDDNVIYVGKAVVLKDFCGRRAGKLDNHWNIE